MSAGSRPRKWLVSLLLLCACAILAQRIISFRKISVNDGLAQSSITYLMQDSRGYIWITTGDGLCRYDGYSFKVFRPEPGNPNSITSSATSIVREDGNQNIWVGTIESLECYNPRTGEFTHYINDPNDSTTITRGIIFDLMFDNAGKVWICTSNGLDILDPLSGHAKHFRHTGGDPVNTIPGNSISGIASFGDKVLIGTDSGMCIVNSVDYSIHQIPGSPIKHCRHVLDDGAGRVFVHADTAMYEYSFSKNEFKVIAQGIQMGPNGTYAPFEMTALRKDIDSVYWTGGWMRLAPIVISDTGIQHVVCYSNGFWPTSTSSLLIDHGQNLWVGGEGSELLTGNIHYTRFLSYRVPYPGQSPHIVNSVWSSAEDTSGNLWVGSYGSVQRLDPATGNMKLYVRDKNNPRSLQTEGAFVTFCDSKGRVWIDGSFNLCMYNKNSDDFTTYSPIPGDTTSHPKRNVSCMYETRNGDLWLGMYGYNMVKFDPETGKFRPYRQPKGSQYAASHSVVRSIYEDETGTMWVGTALNFDRFDPEQGRYYPALSKKWQSEFNAIESAGPGQLWLGSSVYGLLKYDIKSDSIIEQYDEAVGLANNCVYDIVKDKDGILWISTNKGLSRFDPATKSFRNFDHSDGIQHNEFSGGAGTITNSGWVIFGCSDGITMFKPELMRDNPYPPKVLITKMRLFNKEVGISSFKEYYNDSSTFWIADEGLFPVLPIDISFVQNLELNYDQNFLSFDFVAMHYSSPAKNQYAYMMEGLEDKWNMVGTQRTASYTNLPPGEYTFRVKASNCDGVWNEEGKSIHIIVNPPWWQTWWFRSLAVLSLIGGVAGYFRYRTAALRRRQKELEHTVKERTAEVVAQKEEITHQKHIVEEKQKEIIDSINYAQRIQRALLAGDKLLKENLGDHFVLFKPKDIVAGDFYWGTPLDDSFMLITADCTGHGVPGAFMSLLNISKLSETINEKNITRPDLVLNNVRSEIIRSLNPDPSKDVSQDGMDCILCKLDLKNRKLEYAAANNSFYIVRDKQLISCPADKMPVGKSHDDTKPFALHEVRLEPGDVIYTLTDGYADQFGGPKGKKFKYKQLEEMLIEIAHEPMEKQKQILSDTVEKWRGNLEQVDDICIIGIRVS